jgi:hypothetical protein
MKDFMFMMPKMNILIEFINEIIIYDNWLFEK